MSLISDLVDLLTKLIDNLVPPLDLGFYLFLEVSTRLVPLFALLLSPLFDPGLFFDSSFTDPLLLLNSHDLIISLHDRGMSLGCKSLGLLQSEFQFLTLCLFLVQQGLQLGDVLLYRNE